MSDDDAGERGDDKIQKRRPHEHADRQRDRQRENRRGNQRACPSDGRIDSDPIPDARR